MRQSLVRDSLVDRIGQARQPMHRVGVWRPARRSARDQFFDQPADLLGVLAANLAQPNAFAQAVDRIGIVDRPRRLLAPS